VSTRSCSSTRAGGSWTAHRCPSTSCPEVIREVGDDVEVMIDAGIMNGADIVASIAMGAKFTRGRGRLDRPGGRTRSQRARPPRTTPSGRRRETRSAASGVVPLVSPHASRRRASSTLSRLIRGAAAPRRTQPGGDTGRAGRGCAGRAAGRRAGVGCAREGWRRPLSVPGRAPGTSCTRWRCVQRVPTTAT